MNEIKAYQDILGKSENKFSTNLNYFDWKDKRIFYPKITRLSQEIEEAIKKKDVNKLLSLFYNKPHFTFKKEYDTITQKSKQIFETNKTESPEVYKSLIAEYITLYKNLIELQKKTDNSGIHDFYTVLPKIIDNGNTVNNTNNKNFRFKSIDECKTTKRSAKYYYSKKDLLEIIKNNKSLLDKFPKNYKSLSKDDICKNIFK